MGVGYQVVETDANSDASDLGNILAQTGDSLGVSFVMGVALVALSLVLMKLAETHRRMRRKMAGRRH